MEYKTNKEIDKSTIIWLDNFEEKLCNDLKRLLKKDVYIVNTSSLLRPRP